MKPFVLFAAILTLAACDLELAAITPAPPGTTAALDACEQTIELTRGVAVGIDCRDAGVECEAMAVEVDDPAVASAYLSFDSELDEDAYNRYQPRTSLVLVGRAAGQTFLHVDAAEGSVTYEVTVLEP